MKRRTAALALGATVLALGLAAGVLAIYPFSYDTPHGADDGAERFTLDLGEEFRLSGRVVTGGEELVQYEAVRAADGGRYEYVQTDAELTEVYQGEPGGERYRLYRYPDEAGAEPIRSEVERTESRTLVADERVDGDIRLLVVDETPRETDGTVEGAEVMLLNGLQSFTAFDLVDSAGDTRVYGPRTGWYTHSERTGEYRVTDASGRVAVDAGTNAVTSANVSVRYTTASSFLDQLGGEGETETVETTVEVETAPASVEEPDWVQEIRNRR